MKQGVRPKSQLYLAPAIIGTMPKATKAPTQAARLPSSQNDVHQLASAKMAKWPIVYRHGQVLISEAMKGRDRSKEPDLRPSHQHMAPVPSMTGIMAAALAGNSMNWSGIAASSGLICWTPWPPLVPVIRKTMVRGVPGGA